MAVVTAAGAWAAVERGRVGRAVVATAEVALAVVATAVAMAVVERGGWRRRW